MTEKESELVQQLLEKTRAKAVAWEPTARENEFVAPYKGRATFTISKQDRYPGEFVLIMRDQDNREMLLLEAPPGNAHQENLFSALYKEAHDSALKVEETLDAILEDLRRAS